MSLGRELLRSLAGTNVVPRLVVERPEPEWRIGVLTVVVGKQRARLRYAREPVGSVRPNAREIAIAWRRVVDKLQARSLSPDELLPRLGAAYATVLAKHAKRSADRAPLVEIRAELAGYTRAQFAWDLARLRRERRLVIEGRRVDLGIATGHAAMRKSRVVWIEDDRGGGAFYESLRLIEHKERP
ncbi:MAG: hypothetical protein JWO36_3902 [Myxococcales bacterium]|nr:hypothetical protein [Myxococcales bacterium]